MQSTYIEKLQDCVFKTEKYAKGYRHHITPQNLFERRYVEDLFSRSGLKLIPYQTSWRCNDEGAIETIVFSEIAYHGKDSYIVH